MCCTIKIGGISAGNAVKTWVSAGGPPVEAAIDIILSLAFDCWTASFAWTLVLAASNIGEGSIFDFRN